METKIVKGLIPASAILSCVIIDVNEKKKQLKPKHQVETMIAGRVQHEISVSHSRRVCRGAVKYQRLFSHVHTHSSMAVQ